MATLIIEHNDSQTFKLVELCRLESLYVPEPYDILHVCEDEYRVSKVSLHVSSDGSDPFVTVLVKPPIPLPDSVTNPTLRQKIAAKIQDFHWSVYPSYTSLTLATLYVIHRLTN